jgi:hypothetical protein
VGARPKLTKGDISKKDAGNLRSPDHSECWPRALLRAIGGIRNYCLKKCGSTSATMKPMARISSGHSIMSFASRLKKLRIFDSAL